MKRLYITIIILFSGTLCATQDSLYTAPTFFARSFEGENFFLSNRIEQKKPFVLSFFATWCVPCMKEMPILDSLNVANKGLDVYFVNVSGMEVGGVVMKEKTKDIEKIITALDIRSTVLLDKYGKIAEKYGISMLPALFLVDPVGSVIFSHAGYVPGDEKKLIARLENLNKDYPGTIFVRPDLIEKSEDEK